jgi:hypothetical protein
VTRNAARARTLVRELASRLEDFYREVVAGGMTESAADAHARAQITDWTRLARTLRSVDRLTVGCALIGGRSAWTDYARKKQSSCAVNRNLAKTYAGASANHRVTCLSFAIVVH